MTNLISEYSVAQRLFRMLSVTDSWAVLSSCTDTFLWASVATCNTPAERPGGANLTESDLPVQAEFRLWGYKHN